MGLFNLLSNDLHEVLSGDVPHPNMRATMLNGVKLNARS
jgi:hypothetical protein